MLLVFRILWVICRVCMVTWSILCWGSWKEHLCETGSSLLLLGTWLYCLPQKRGWGTVWCVLYRGLVSQLECLDVNTAELEVMWCHNWWGETDPSGSDELKSNHEPEGGGWRCRKSYQRTWDILMLLEHQLTNGAVQGGRASWYSSHQFHSFNQTLSENRVSHLT